MLITLALGAPLALSGCGWAPLYAEPASGPASEELRAIYVEPILERIAGAAHTHDTPATCKAQLRGFVGEPRRIGGERRRHQIGDAKRISEVGTDGARHHLGPLAHQALIRAVQQRRADFGVGSLQERGNPCRSYLHDRSARRRRLLGEPALHEQGQPRHDLLVEFGRAANRGIVFADHR